MANTYEVTRSVETITGEKLKRTAIVALAPLPRALDDCIEFLQGGESELYAWADIGRKAKASSDVGNLLNSADEAVKQLSLIAKNFRLALPDYTLAQMDELMNANPAVAALRNKASDISEQIEVDMNKVKLPRERDE